MLYNIWQQNSVVLQIELACISRKCKVMQIGHENPNHTYNKWNRWNRGGKYTIHVLQCGKGSYHKQDILTHKDT